MEIRYTVWTSSEIERATLPNREILRNLRKVIQPGGSHDVELLTIDCPEEHPFHEIEAAANPLSVRELLRQIGSSLDERLALSRDKPQVPLRPASEAARRIATIGIVLYHRKNDAHVELNLPENATIFASR